MRSICSCFSSSTIALPIPSPFIAGLVGGYLLHARFVFDARPGRARRSRISRRTRGCIVVSLLVLYVAVARLGVPKPLGMLAALAFTVPHPSCCCAGLQTP
jgi:putative flippase GtrA